MLIRFKNELGVVLDLLDVVYWLGLVINLVSLELWFTFELGFINPLRICKCLN